jgi:hypothetical protein
MGEKFLYILADFARGLRSSPLVNDDISLNDNKYLLKSHLRIKESKKRLE